LPAGAPVNLDGVVGRRVVAGGDHDAARALFVPDGEGKLGRAAMTIKKTNAKAICGHDTGAKFRKMAGSVTSVVSDGA